MLKKDQSHYNNNNNNNNNNSSNNNNNNNNNSLEEFYTQKRARHEPSGWAMFMRCSFDKKENKLIIEQRIALTNYVKN